MPIVGPSQGGCEDAAGAAEKPPCVALVPLNPAAPRLEAKWWRWSPDASFVAHLMACQRQAPQTRRVRRATAADAQLAYRARVPVPAAGCRTRQVV